MATLEGDLSLMPLPDLVIWMANRQNTGTLTVQRGPEQQTFDLVDGAVVRAASNQPRQYFGQFLLHFELVTEEQLQQAYHTQRETGVRLGRILEMIGLAPPERVVECLYAKIQETLLHAFRWTNGRFRLSDEHRHPAEREISVAVPLLDIHTESHRREPVWEAFEALFPDSQLLVGVNDARIPRTLTRGSFADRILSLARAGLNLEALTLETRATDFALAAELVELHRSGAIVPRQPTTGLVPPIVDEETTSHLDLAEKALTQGRYSEALAHATASVSEGPHDPRSVALVAHIDGLAKTIDPRHPARSARPVLTAKPEANDVRRLTAKERYILARIDGKRTVQAIMQVSPMHDVEALDIIRNFERDAWITLRQD